MSTHVIGFRPPDKRWHEMKAIYDACEKAGIDIPNDVSKFFEDEPPDPLGVRVRLDKTAIKEYSADMEDGYEVDLTKLPKDVTVLRFFNSY